MPICKRTDKFVGEARHPIVPLAVDRRREKLAVVSNYFYGEPQASHPNASAEGLRNRSGKVREHLSLLILVLCRAAEFQNINLLPEGCSFDSQVNLRGYNFQLERFQFVQLRRQRHQIDILW